MAERDLTQLRETIANLRKEYNVIIQLWSEEDLAAVIADRDYDITNEQAAEQAAVIWPTVLSVFQEATVPFGYEVMDGIVDDVEGK